MARLWVTPRSCNYCESPVRKEGPLLRGLIHTEPLSLRFLLSSAELFIWSPSGKQLTQSGWRGVCCLLWAYCRLSGRAWPPNKYWGSPWKWPQKQLRFNRVTSCGLSELSAPTFKAHGRTGIMLLSLISDNLLMLIMSASFVSLGNWLKDLILDLLDLPHLILPLFLLCFLTSCPLVCGPLPDLSELSILERHGWRPLHAFRGHPGTIQRGTCLPEWRQHQWTR